MDDSSKSVEVICPKCGKRFHEPLRGFSDEQSTRCPGCGYHVFTDSITLANFMEAHAKFLPDP